MRLARRALALLLAAPALARAQAFPSQPVRILLPQPPGSANDAVARIIAEPMARALGQAVVVDNRPGANGTVAVNALKQQRPDGHALLLSGVSQLSFNPHLYPTLPYDPVRDFTYVAPVTDAPFILLASKRSGIASVPDLLARARAQPGRITYASAGIGNSTHLSMEMIADRAGVSFLHVPYPGSGQALTSVVSGETDAMIIVLGVALGQVRAGAVTPLALVAKRRVPALPDLPTQREAGIEAPVMPGWFGLLGPAGMPEDPVTALNAAVRAALADETAQRRLADNLLVPFPGSAADLRRRMEADSAVWGEFIRRRGLRPD
ncbi:Bug family tripartite tricarboxylate transporter substrate binding protein [Paracraurococcus ruber]|uniref:ABC transporter substrate-binding protein n=1 Tax=Paracraurococcus ruber TaxID=77675 RepID=A0ABS1CUZ7_9PROT|nr:tripartite tricarboxylate transporter substrate binding protein [Paracraurococcus ruber]MBK1658126.1 ABC transporter substrate-binding protein [Paracraurococcus ruber]TDG28888.1 tripartite tricarboxylate transporter substrate binding protein [Paracraurococcus ruber]